MRREVLTQLLQRDPCPILRLHISNGTVFEILDPDLAVITRSTVELLLSTDSGEQNEVVVNLLHIIWIEVLPPTV